MKNLCRSPVHFRASIALSALLFAVATAYARDPLPSWNDGPAKKAIISFVKETTEKSSPKYVEPKDRIATFDQDGTLDGTPVVRTSDVRTGSFGEDGTPAP
jgi:hypothetical protein